MDAIQIIDGYIQHKHGTSTEWATENPVLLAWELGLETDTKLGKIGDGATPWNSLPYAFGGAAMTITTGNTDGTIAVNGTDVSVKNVGTTFNLDRTDRTIPNSADLNTYTTPGTYYCGGSTQASSYSNCPHTSSGFKMIVMATTSAQYVMQIIYAYTGQTYVRGINTGGSGTATYRAWKHLAYDNFGTCSTGASTVAKTVSISAFNLITGAEATVLFTNGNTATNPTLNIASTGAKAIWYNGTNIGNIDANMVIKVVYDGTRYRVVGKL